MITMGTRIGLTLAALGVGALAASPALAVEASRMGARSFATASPNTLGLLAMAVVLFAFMFVAFVHWRVLSRAIDQRPRAVRRRSALR